MALPADSRGPVSYTHLDVYKRQDLRNSLADGQRVLMHQEELGDRVMGVVAGFLVWSGRLPTTPQAVAMVEHMIGRQMGPPGRELVVAVHGPAPRRAG